MQPDSATNQDAVAPAPQDTANTPNPLSAGSPSEEARTNAMLAWIFAPFTSFAWKDDKDEFIKAHAGESLYIGIAQAALFIVILGVQACFSITFFNSFGLGMIGLAGIFGLALSILWFAFWVFAFVPRIIGAINANNGQIWRLKEVSALVKRFVKL